MIFLINLIVVKFFSYVISKIGFDSKITKLISFIIILVVTSIILYFLWIKTEYIMDDYKVYQKNHPEKIKEKNYQASIEEQIYGDSSNYPNEDIYNKEQYSISSTSEYIDYSDMDDESNSSRGGYHLTSDYIRSDGTEVSGYISGNPDGIESNNIEYMRDHGDSDGIQEAYESIIDW